MEDEALTPATHEDLRETLAFALTHNSRGKATRQWSDSMAPLAAERLIEYLEQCGYVVMKRPPPPPWSAPAPYR